MSDAPFSIHYMCKGCFVYDTYHAFANDGWSIDVYCMACKEWGKKNLAQAIEDRRLTLYAVQEARRRYKAGTATKQEVQELAALDTAASEKVRRLKKLWGWNRIRMHTDPAQRIPFASKHEAMEACEKGYVA